MPTASRATRSFELAVARRLVALHHDPQAPQAAPQRAITAVFEAHGEAGRARAPPVPRRNSQFAGPGPGAAGRRSCTRTQVGRRSSARAGRRDLRAARADPRRRRREPRPHRNPPRRSSGRHAAGPDQVGLPAGDGELHQVATRARPVVRANPQHRLDRPPAHVARGRHNASDPVEHRWAAGY